MNIIDQIHIKNNKNYNDIIVAWQGYSKQKIKVSIKYQLMGKTGWAEFIDGYKDSINQMVSFHRKLKGERGIYSFLFTCKNIGDMDKEIASYRVDNIMLGNPIKIYYDTYTIRNIDYLEFTNIEDNYVIPSNSLYIETEHKKYPIGFNIREGSKVSILKSVTPKLCCIKPYEEMYKLIPL